MPLLFRPGRGNPPALVSIFGDPNEHGRRLLAYEVGATAIAPTKNLSFDITGFYNVYDHLLIHRFPIRQFLKPARPRGIC